MKRLSIFLLAGATMGVSVLPAFADFTIIMKSGGRISVQTYREEAGIVKFQRFGGEIGIPKDQIQSILPASQTEKEELSISALEARPRQIQTSETPSPPALRELNDGPSPSQAKSRGDPAEEKEYQKKLADVTHKLEVAKQDYYNATQGGGTANNASNDGLKAWTMDLASRIHDSQKIQGGGGRQSTPPSPPYAPNYTPKEKELSTLRILIDALQKERDYLVQEMKSKNIQTDVP